MTALHHEEVWRGRAATASRTRLRHVIGAALYSLGLDLATTSRGLRSEAFELEQEAAALRRRASVLAEAEARAAMRSRPVPVSPAGVLERSASAGSVWFPRMVLGTG